MNDLTKENGWRTMYKVVKVRSDGTLISSMGIVTSPEICLTYSAEHVTYPQIEGSKLFVFRTKEQAFEFIKNSNSKRVRVYSCKALNCTPLKKKIKIVFNPNEIRKYWE